MSTSEQRDAAAALNALISKASSSEAWFDAADTEGLPQSWQQEAVSRILVLTYGQELHYLSLASPESGDWEIVAFTDATVVRVTVVRTTKGVSHVESLALPRSSLESLELLDVAPLSDDKERWPDELNLIGHYRGATLRLPMDKFASSDNRKDLVALLSSLLSDLSH